MSDSPSAGEGTNASGTSTDGTGDGPPRSAAGESPVMTHVMQNKVETTLWLTRIFTVVFTILFIIPVFGGNPHSFYQRALIAAAATSALRMHQRIPHIQLNLEFVRHLFTEDASHYLMYSLIFLSSYPMTMSLVPIFLFALLHACSYTKTLLNLMGPTSLMFVRNLVSKLEAHQVQILRFIASTEIFLMPAIIILIFTGKCSIFLPFVYYRFLTLRYCSRRNPYSRALFSEFHQAALYFSSRPQCPQFVRGICYKAINLITWLAPAVQTQ